MQAAIGRIQLRKMNKWNRIRQRNAIEIIKVLKKISNLVDIPLLPSLYKSCFLQSLCLYEFDQLKKRLD